MDELVAKALSMLPASGEIVFDAYKASLQSEMPDNAKDVFTFILKNNLLGRQVRYDKDGNIQVYLSRKAA
jgi:hypothetical protein